MTCPHQNPFSPDTCERCEPVRPEFLRIRDGFQTLAYETDVELDELLIPMRAALTIVRDVLSETPTVTYRPHIETR